MTSRSAVCCAWPCRRISLRSDRSVRACNWKGLISTCPGCWRRNSAPSWNWCRSPAQTGFRICRQTKSISSFRRLAAMRSATRSSTSRSRIRLITIDGPADMAGKTVGVARGTFEDLMLTKSVPPSTMIKRFEDNSGMISAYLAGQVPLVGTGDFVATKIATTFPASAPNKPALKYVIHESACHVGLNKGEPKLQAKVDAILTEAKKDGELNSIVEKWLHVPLPQKMAQSMD